MTLSPDPAASAADAAAEGAADYELLVARLAAESHAFDGSGCDPERNCWMVVHRHLHGMLPSEYDIREIDEDLYIAVLAYRNQSQQGI